MRGPTQNCGPDQFSRFDAYWIQANKRTPTRTDRQEKYIYRDSKLQY